MKTQTTQVNVIANTLSDGSKVWSVQIDEAEIPCTSEKDALQFAEKLVAALDQHTP